MARRNDYAVIDACSVSTELVGRSEPFLRRVASVEPSEFCFVPLYFVAVRHSAGAPIGSTSTTPYGASSRVTIQIPFGSPLCWHAAQCLRCRLLHRRGTDRRMSCGPGTSLPLVTTLATAVVASHGALPSIHMTCIRPPTIRRWRRLRPVVDNGWYPHWTGVQWLVSASMVLQIR